jgi:hypothetical protein
MDVNRQFEMARIRRAEWLHEAETRHMIRQAFAERNPRPRRPLRARAGQLFLAIGGCLVGARAALPPANAGGAATPAARRPISYSAPTAKSATSCATLSRVAHDALVRPAPTVPHAAHTSSVMN